MVNPVVGIIGGGQLGSLLADAAKKINIKTVIFSDDNEAPGKNFADEFLFGSYNNEDKIKEFINKVDIVTFEFENIPYETLKKINEYKKVLPKPKINKIIQNRLSEKDFLNEINISTTKYVSIKNDRDLKSNNDLVPGILKTCTMGYDGKGQYKINSIEELENLTVDFKKEFIFEKIINLKKEISIIITRYSKQKYEIYEPIENIHEDQILKYSKIPAQINSNIFERSKEWAIKISEELDYIGTLCIEYFIDKNDNLYVNEIAPRVHNSGHLTINTHNVSQFENHIRAICGLEQIKLKKNFNAKMVNLIGDNITAYRGKELKKNEHFFDYLKKEIKKKRKMGHITITEKC